VTFTLRSLLYLIVSSSLAFALHLWLVFAFEIDFPISQIIWAYVANVLLTSGLIVWLLNLPEKYNTSLGYFFLYGSFAKAIMFFVLFYPGYRADGEVSRPEFSAFFVPYAICLVVETTALIIKLKQSDNP
jgi:hypothetical protein